MDTLKQDAAKQPEAIVRELLDDPLHYSSYTIDECRVLQSELRRLHSALAQQGEPVVWMTEEEAKRLRHCMIAVRDWLSEECDKNDIPRPHIAALVAYAGAAPAPNTNTRTVMQQMLTALEHLLKAHGYRSYINDEEKELDHDVIAGRSALAAGQKLLEVLP